MLRARAWYPGIGTPTWCKRLAERHGGWSWPSAGVGGLAGGVAASRAGRGCYPARAGGLWLWMTLVLSRFHAVVVPSEFRTRVQPIRWIITW